MNRSKVALTAWSGRAAGRSILLTTRMTLQPLGQRLASARSASAAIGPSTASTSSSAPSTMFMHALHLAAEVGMAGRVDDVDRHAGL
jgi:hypothetical protein